MKPEKTHQIQYNYSSLPVEMQLGNPCIKWGQNRLSPARRRKLTKSSLLLKTMISDFFLSSGAFLYHNPINKPAKNNKRNVDSNCISLRRSSAKRHVKISQDDTKLCQLQLSVNKSQMPHKFSTWILFASSSPINSCSLPFRLSLFPVPLHLQANM